MDILHIVRISWFTFLQAALSTGLALLIGLPAAFFCGRRVFPGRKFLLSLSSIPFCMPPLIVALGYVTFLGISGGLNQFLMFAFGLKEPPVRILYSFFGLIVAHGFYNFPLIMKSVSDAWKHLPKEEAESARLLGASEFRIFRTVTIYQLAPSVASSSLLTFIYCFLSFMLVLLFGGIGNSTLEVEIYKSARATLDFSTVGILAAIETSILTLIMIFYSFLERRSSNAKGIASENLLEPSKLSKPSEISVFVPLLALITVFFLAPLAGIAVNAFSASAFSRILKMKSLVPSIKNTFFSGILTASACTLLGILYSSILKLHESSGAGKSRNKNFLSIFLNVFPMLPMCISSVVTGVAIMMIVRKGTVFHLVMAQTILSWPLAFRQIHSSMTKIPQQTMDSALLLSKNRLSIVLRVLIPVSRRGILSAFGFSFAVSAGDTTLPLVLSIPKFDTLSLFTYRLAGAYRFNEACASGLLLGTLCALVFALSGWSSSKK